MALTAAFLGWMFDGMEMGIFPLVARPALQEMQTKAGIKLAAAGASSVPALTQGPELVQPSSSTAARLSSSATDFDIVALFESGSCWLVLASFLGFGLLLAFTPCMLPMIPILSGIIVGQGENLTKSRAMLMSTSYVMGMAITYSAAGVAAVRLAQPGGLPALPARNSSPGGGVGR